MLRRFDFTNFAEAQDMIFIISKEKKLTYGEAIASSINKEILNRIENEGYAAIAISLWGHANPMRKWKVLKEPILQVELDGEKFEYITQVMKKNNLSNIQDAISYFLIFTVEALGYHI